MLDEIGQDYVRTARAKGVSEKRILWVHVLRNAAIPIITYVMSNLPSLLIGAFLVERFFSIPGIGREIPKMATMPATLDEALGQMDESFSEMLLRKIDERGMEFAQFPYTLFDLFYYKIRCMSIEF